MPIDVQVLEQPAATAALDPLRSDILATLAEPGSATTVARALGMPRQKVNYHLRVLEEHGLVELVQERPRRGVTERVVQASARSYLVSPAALGANAADPQRADRLSSHYLLAVAARLIAEVGRLSAKAEAAGKPLATMTIDSEIKFASAADRASFTAELGQAVTALAARYQTNLRPRDAGTAWSSRPILARPLNRRPQPKNHHTQQNQERDHERGTPVH